MKRNQLKTHQHRRHRHRIHNHYHRRLQQLLDNLLLQVVDYQLLIFQQEKFCP
jgi:hypothetical protein